jgi:hypothetical protein
LIDSIGQRMLRCSLLRPDPAQRARLEEILDNLLARIAEAEREGWLGEIEGLRISLAGAEDKLARIDQRSSRAIDLGMPGRAAGPVLSTAPCPVSAAHDWRAVQEPP